MSWQTFQKDAFTLTDREIKRLTVQTLTQYREAIKAISLRLNRVYLRLTGVSPENYYNEILKRNRLEILLKQVRAEYIAFSLKANTFSKQALSLSMSNVYYRKLYASQWLTLKPVFGLLPEGLIKLTVFGTKEAWNNITGAQQNKFGDRSFYVPQTGTLAELLLKNREQELSRIKTAITQSFVNGQSFCEAVNNIRSTIGKEINLPGGRTKLTGAKANALRIIRTETNRIQNMGSYAATKQLQANNVGVQRQYVAVLDFKTRPQSASMDGQRRNVDEPFTYPNGATALTPGTSGVAQYDINDRCGVIDIIDGKNPEIRRGRNPVTGKNEVFTYKDFNAWAQEHDLTKNFYGQVVSE